MATPSKVGSLYVEIGADTSGFDKGVKQIAEQTRDATTKIAKIAGAASLAIAAAGTAIVSSTIKSTRELNSQARAAGLLTEELQRGAFAASKFGVEQDKYADILKDVNDKVGDFLTTGAGGMVDFFEQVAPKVGVTAEAFKGLSSQQALGLYVDTLQKANLSQSEMTFHMEALASDSTRLIPLFQDGGKALNDLTAEATAYGIGLSQIDAKNIEDAGRAFDSALAATEAVAQQFTAQLSPVITEVINGLMTAGAESGYFAEASGNAFNFVVKAAGHVANAIKGFEVIFKSVELGATVSFMAIMEAGNQVQQFFARMTNTVIGGVNTMIEGINALGGSMEKLSGVTAGGGFFEGMSDAFSAQAETIRGELQGLLSEPLPSDSIDKFVAQAVERATLAGEAEEAVRVEQLERRIENDDIESERLAEVAQMRLDAAKSYADYELEIEAGKVKAKRDLMNNMAGLMNSESRKMFEIGKAAAASNVLISGLEEIQDASKWGMKIGGPPVAAAFAAVAGASVFTRLQAINSAKFGGSGGAASYNSSGQEAVNVQTETQVASINIIGGDNSTFTGDQVRSLIGSINEAVGDGVELRTN